MGSTTKKIGIIAGIAFLLWLFMPKGSSSGNTQPGIDHSLVIGPQPQPPTPTHMLLSVVYDHAGEPMPCYLELVGSRGRQVIQQDPATCSVNQFLDQVRATIAANYAGEPVIYIEERQPPQLENWFRNALVAAVKAAGIPRVEWVAPAQQNRLSS